MLIDGTSFYIKNNWKISLDMAYSLEMSVDGIIRSQHRDYTFDKYKTNLTASITTIEEAHFIHDKLEDIKQGINQITISFDHAEKIFGPHISSTSVTASILDVGEIKRVGKELWEITFNLMLCNDYVINESIKSLELVSFADYDTGRSVNGVIVETVDPRGISSFSNNVKIGFAEIQTSDMTFAKASAVLSEIITTIRHNSFKIPSRWDKIKLFDSTSNDKYSFIKPSINITIKSFDLCSISFSLIEDIS